MLLSRALATFFPRQVRDRGHAYCFAGRVSVLSAEGGRVEAAVRGGGVYRVTLLLSGSTLELACTCPYQASYASPCKHVWATILAAEQRGCFDRWTPASGLSIRGVAFEAGRRERVGAQPPVEDPPSPVPFPRFGVPNAEHLRYSAPSLHEPSPAWKQHLEGLSRTVRDKARQPWETWRADREILYFVDVAATLQGGALVIDVACRDRRQTGEWGAVKQGRFGTTEIDQLREPADRCIVSLLAGPGQDLYGESYGYRRQCDRFRLRHSVASALLPLLCATGRCRLRLASKRQETPPLSFDSGAPWEFRVQIEHDAREDVYVVVGGLQRGAERMPLETPELLTAGGFVFTPDRVAALDDGGAFEWIVMLRRQKSITVPGAQIDEFLESVFALPALPKLDLPESLQLEEVLVQPRPCFKLRSGERRWGARKLGGDLSFEYCGVTVAERGRTGSIVLRAQRRVIRRDAAAEEEARACLRQLGLKLGPSYEDAPGWETAPSRAARVITALVEKGWRVEAEGKLYRQPGEWRVEVKTGIDWFELHGRFEFGDQSAALPDLLAALRRRENVVLLGDGTYGLLPDEWLRKYGFMAGMGATEGDHLRFRRNQVGVLDALLASQSSPSFDEAFAQARRELLAFGGIGPEAAPAGFQGELRGYQREGLGWFRFLRRFGFGGCLADDMGLGKTVQVLALLESRRGRSGFAADSEGENGCGTSLVVVPKSLVFNWIQEAARFTPKLRVLDYTGLERHQALGHFEDYDLVITTYGTLRRDAVQFRDFEFDHVILDEAQAIKNPQTDSAKSVRLLKGRHRLALSGTPIENHLGELWSLFQFLNPGMLGGAAALRTAAKTARELDQDSRQLLASALRPLILRRTKEQVARDLPAKVEQTIYCELETTQRKLYDQLKDHYRAALLGLIQEQGLANVKIQVLEALLRLRQAACHPGLIDPARQSAASGKLEMLFPLLEEVNEEGHKALVFSQFTSLLSLVRKRLDQDRVAYEYLDGATRDRAACVERFQQDPGRKLFLISLKAGGLGLNLTAADYVFLLDPWWNPAVEAQAIDRTHRIGQTQQVFAYRLIAKDTVEEKVLELQQRKRDLADAIITADNALIRDLSGEDLDLLLS